MVDPASLQRDLDDALTEIGRKCLELRDAQLQNTRLAARCNELHRELQEEKAKHDAAGAAEAATG